MKTLSEGKKALEQLIKSAGNGDVRNEAETRFHIIDVLIEHCLGWDKSLIEVERHQNRSFTDYELGAPRQIIWEAKKEGTAFELPVNHKKRLLIDIPSIIEISKEIKEAFEQVQKYCTQRGVQTAVVTNGKQLAAFLAVRTDGVSPFEGKALVFDSLDHILNEFSSFWKFLSFDGVLEKKIVRYLTTGDTGIPLKLSSRLMYYPKIRYQSDTQASLKQLSELLIQDIIESRDIEETFYKNCYCESGALSKYSLLSKQILEARYASLFDESKPHPLVKSVKPSKKENAFTPEVMAEALSKRPIVLIGDVGVGKTSFVKHLMYISAYKEFQNAIYIYIDLGSKASLVQDLKEFILDEIERQLNDKYEIDTNKENFVKGVYASDIQRFSNSIWGQYKENNPEKYKEKMIEMLEKKIKVKDQHLKQSINHLSKQSAKQIIISLDNSDQREFDIQQQAFIISQELSKEWNATVFISVRPQTFYKSKQSGALTAYPNRIFTISPPRIDTVIKKRLEFALKMAQGEVPIEGIKNVSLETKSLSLFLKTLIFSLNVNKEIGELLTNITGGNVRSVIELVRSFIGSPNVDAEKIIDIMDRKREYLIPIHEFSKSALLGDYSHFNPESSIAMNIFDTCSADVKEHFLIPILLSYLNTKGNHKDKNGFVQSPILIEELQSLGYLQGQIELSLRRSTNKKLIETSQRITFEEDETGLIGEMPTSFRMTTVGVYHLNRWMNTFGYLDAMVFDTPIFDKDVFERLSGNVESLYINHRFERAVIFKQYLFSCWTEMVTTPEYFNFSELLSLGDESFNRVQKVIQ